METLTQLGKLKYRTDNNLYGKNKEKFATAVARFLVGDITQQELAKVARKHVDIHTLSVIYRFTADLYGKAVLFTDFDTVMVGTNLSPSMYSKGSGNTCSVATVECNGKQYTVFPDEIVLILQDNVQA